MRTLTLAALAIALAACKSAGAPATAEPDHRDTSATAAVQPTVAFKVGTDPGHAGARHRARAAPRARAGRLRRGVLLGRRGDLPPGARRRRHRGRLQRRAHRRSTYESSAPTPRPRRDRARRVRPRGRQLRDAAQRLLQEPRPHHEEPPGPRRRRPVPQRDVHVLARAGRGRRHRQGARGRRCEAPGGHDDRADRPFWKAEEYHQQYDEKTGRIRARRRRGCPTRGRDGAVYCAT